MTLEQTITVQWDAIIAALTPAERRVLDVSATRMRWSERLEALIRRQDGAAGFNVRWEEDGLVKITVESEDRDLGSLSGVKEPKFPTLHQLLDWHMRHFRDYVYYPCVVETVHAPLKSPNADDLDALGFVFLYGSDDVEIWRDREGELIGLASDGTLWNSGRCEVHLLENNLPLGTITQGVSNG